LPFVSIIIDKNPRNGIVTDVNGRFRIVSNSTINNLTFSCVGYKSLDTAQLFRENIQFNIKLQRKVIDIQEITVIAGENPAHRIIRKTVDNKDVNNPDNLSSYSCRVYNKTVFDFIPNPDLMEENKYLKLKQLSDSMSMLVTESSVDRIYRYKHKLYENIDAVRVSGFQKPTFGPLNGDIQPFHFYNDYLTLYDKSFLNPVSKGSTRKYNFSISDTLYPNQADSVFVISFEPRTGQTFDGLKGCVYINTNRYAIQYFKASPSDENILYELSINQKYSFIDSVAWFPSELMFDLRYKNYPTPENRARINGETIINQVVINDSSVVNKANENIILFSKEASEKGIMLLETLRPTALPNKDVNCYKIIDSLGREKNFDNAMFLVNRLLEGAIPVKFVDFDISGLYNFNSFEGNRPGISLHTNNKLLPWFSAGGFVAKGLSDHIIKYGADIRFLMLKKPDFEMKFGYFYDVRERGFYAVEFDEPYNYLRRLMSNQMELVEQYSASFKYRFNYLIVKTLLSSEKFLSDISKENVDYKQFNPEFTSTQVSISLRYAYQEKRVPLFGHYFSMGSRYPIVYLNITKGFPDLFNSNCNYLKLSLSLSKSFIIRNLGTTNINIESSLLNGNVPITRLFTGNGSYYEKNPYYISQSFNTMGLYEFSCNRFINVFISNNFGNILFNTKYSKPELYIIQHSGISYLTDNQQERYPGAIPYDKGYFESGVLLNNILRFNFVNAAYFGFGGGAFIKYGYYFDDDLKNNFAYKFSVSLSF
jgi:hypothetical protein